ncbi:MAG: arginine--tRNA ligase [Candidatus Falkowbacteria bacterium]
MYLLEQITKKLAKEVNEALNLDLVNASDFVYPPNPEMGDLSLACFAIAKSSKQSPNELAQFLVGKIKSTGLIRGVQAVGPYCNISLNKSLFCQKLMTEIAKNKDQYGKNTSGKKARVMIEYSNGNTHKEYHVGHLRNISYGDSVYRLLAANGYEAIPVSYINDFGIHVAKTLWWLTHPNNPDNINRVKPDELENKGYFLGQTYAAASAVLGDNEDKKIEVGEYMHQIESRQGEIYDLWQQTRQWSIDQFACVYQELGVQFVDTFYESDYIDEGLKIAGELYAKHFLVKSQGAVIADLSEYSLNVLMFLRTDGTALYPVADLPLAMAKFKKYKLKKSIYVVDIRQGLYFKQLFKVLELLGYKEEMMHLGYEFVKLPEGMMSSRTGNVVSYEDLKDKTIERARISTAEKHRDWSTEKVEKVARAIAFGAIKFEMLKVSREKPITFDVETSLRFDGYTAAYLQYTCARIASMERKAADIKFDAKGADLDHPKEHALALKLARYPEVIQQAGDNYEPSELAKYLFELAQLVNDYYHDVPVLKADPELAKSRLELLSATKQIIANGFNLLGIEIIDEM